MSEMRIAAQYQELFSRWLRRSSSSSLSGRCCSRLCSLPFGSLLSRLLLSRLSSLDAHGSLARPGLRECCCRRIARKAGNLPAASCRGLTWLAAVGSHAACGWELEVSEVKSWRCSARAAVMLVRGLRCQRSAHARHHPRCCPSSLCCRAWPTTSSRCCPASTTGHLAHRAGLREPASSRRPLTTRLPPTSRCGQQPRRPSARRRPQLYRRRTTCLLHAVAPSAAARPRGSPCSWAAVVEALGCAVLPQAQPSPRLCRRASPSARPSSRRAVLVTRLTTSRPSSPDEQDESPPPRHSALRPRASAMPSRQRRRGPSAASESQQLVACRPAQQPSRAAPHRQDVPTTLCRQPHRASAPRLPQRSLALDQQEPTSAAVPSCRSPTRLAGSSRQQQQRPSASPSRSCSPASPPASSCRGICRWPSTSSQPTSALYRRAARGTTSSRQLYLEERRKSRGQLPAQLGCVPAHEPAPHNKQAAIASRGPSAWE